MEQYSSPEKKVLYEAEGIIVYAEQFLGGEDEVIVAETELETARFYDDGTRSYTNNRSGDVVTYYPGNRFTSEHPGKPLIEGETLFDTTI